MPAGCLPGHRAEAPSTAQASRCSDEATARWPQPSANATMNPIDSRGGRSARNPGLWCQRPRRRSQSPPAGRQSSASGLACAWCSLTSADGIGPIDSGDVDGAESVSMKANREGARPPARPPGGGVRRRRSRRAPPGAGDAAAVIGQIAAEEAADLIVVGARSTRATAARAREPPCRAARAARRRYRS